MKLTSAHEICVGRSLIPLQRAAWPRTWIAFSAILVILLLLLSYPGCVVAGGVAIAMAGDSEAPAAAEPALRSSLLDIAQQAKDRFRGRMNSTAPFLTLADVVLREDTRAARAYALRSFESAIDALLIQATRSADAADAVEAAMRRFVATGKSAATDAIFSEIVEREATGSQAGAGPATAIRNSVALVELPAALAPLIKLPGEALPFAPLGQKALPAYRSAADLDPGEPWTWIALAWMGEAGGTEVAVIDSAVNSGEAAALAARDDDAVIAALQVRARLRLAQGRANEAEGALLAAVRLTEERARVAPDAQEALRNLATELSLLGEFYARRGDHGRAATAYDRALNIRTHLAAASPNDDPRQLDLAASHARLALLAGQAGRGAEARENWDKAFSIYHAVASRHRFTPTLDPAQSGAVAQVFLLTGILTLVGGFVLLALYRSAVDRWMKAASSTSRRSTASVTPSPSAGADAAPQLTIRSLSATGARDFGPPQSVPIAGAARALNGAALVQVFAGCAFAVVATVLTFLFSDLEYKPVQAALIFWSWAWPVVLVLSLLWGGDRKRTALVLTLYFGGLLLICTAVAASDTPPLELFGLTVPPLLQPLVFWALSVAYSAFLIFFLNRRVRSVGPVLLVFTLIASAGGMLALVFMSMYAATRALGALSASLGLSVELVMLLVNLLGMIVLALPAWWAIGGIRRAYRAKWLSDQMLVFDAIWLFQALILCQSLIFEVGLSGWIGLAGFVTYKLIAIVGSWPLAVAASRRPAAKLLLLRVFGFRKRTERLFDVLAARWRHAGPIQMIAAPDLAARTIDPGELMDFLSGRLRRQFVIEPGDLQRRIAEIDLRPDTDGRFRVNDIFCGNDTWQAAVERLMAQSDLVAMDLRGFSPQNRGCSFELQALLDTVAVARFVLLVDNSTDLPLLRRTLEESAGRMAPASPNRVSLHPLTLLEVGSDERRTVDVLLAIGDAVLAEAPVLLKGAGIAPALKSVT